MMPESATETEKPEATPPLIEIRRPKRAVLTREEVLRRTETLETERNEEFVAAVRSARSTVEKASP
jgi:hypothetical protein